MICQHTKDGNIIPLRVRLDDEDGQIQQLSIKSYRCLSAGGKVILPNEVGVTSHILYYECRIVVFEREKIVRLSYNMLTRLWNIEY